MHRFRYRAAAAAAALCVMLAGCSHNEDSDETGYHIFSDGTYISADIEPVPENNGIEYADFYVPEGMVTDYYSRYELSEKEQDIYYEVIEAIGTLEKVVPLPVESTTYRKILETIRIEQLGFAQVSEWTLEYNASAQQFEVIFTYRLTENELSEMNRAAEKAAQEIIAQLTPDMDDYEKLKFFHDYLILNCETDTSYPYADTVYGALVEKKALCEGYSKAFSYLCNLAGIENAIVTGQTYVAHMWNMVKVDGNWYHVDVTWDKPDDELHKKFPDVILYQYFMVTDSVIENNHIIWDYPCEAPRAYGTSENYFAREGADVSAKGELLNASENAIMSAVKRGSASAMVKFDSTDLYISSLNDLANEGIFSSINEKVKQETGRNIKLSWTDYYGQYRILTFIIEYIE